MVNYPEIFRVRQRFESRRIADVPAEVAAQLARLQLAERVRPGQTVAITAGSRGVANMHLVLRAAVAHLARLGAQPFIVPAMGSHAGGTAEGQRALDRVLWDHRGVRRLPDPLLDGDGGRLPRPRRLPGPLRPLRLRGRPCAGGQPHQAAHAVRRRHRERADEDALDRPGQMSGGPSLSYGHPGLQLRPNYSQRGRRGLPPLPHPGRPGDRGECLRPDGPDRGRRCRNSSRPARRPC